MKVEGMEQLNKLFTSLDGMTKEAVSAGLLLFTKDVAEYARQNHPYQNQTGNLEISTQAMPVEVEDGKLVGVVKAGMGYAPNVEFGTSRSAPYPFLTPAVNALSPSLPDRLAAIERGVLNRIVKTGSSADIKTKWQRGK